jgi:diaminopimelate epimerase
MSYPFVKGHGTQNDFVLLPDPDGTVHGVLDPGRVRRLCDRRAGLGGDGVIRVIRTEALRGLDPAIGESQAEWFMDYHNSDGSPSEMCGNGVRVLARYLRDREGMTGDLLIGTRGGDKAVTGGDDGFTVDMGPARVFEDTQVAVGSQVWPATHVDMGNPHAVAFVDDLRDAGPLLEEPSFDPVVYPEGVNVEFARVRGERHVEMRVHERGSGETWSCGTGACAVMVAAARAAHRATGDQVPAESWRVDLPGGTLQVTTTDTGRVLLTGPAVLVAEGVSDL